jgi:hypothetical protein
VRPSVGHDEFARDELWNGLTVRSLLGQPESTPIAAASGPVRRGGDLLL